MKKVAAALVLTAWAVLHTGSAQAVESEYGNCYSKSGVDHYFSHGWCVRYGTENGIVRQAVISYRPDKGYLFDGAAHLEIALADHFKNYRPFAIIKSNDGIFLPGDDSVAVMMLTQKSGFAGYAIDNETVVFQPMEDGGEIVQHLKASNPLFLKVEAAFKVGYQQIDPSGFGDAYSAAQSKLDKPYSE